MYICLDGDIYNLDDVWRISYYEEGEFLRGICFLFHSGIEKTLIMDPENAKNEYEYLKYKLLYKYK